MKLTFMKTRLADSAGVVFYLFHLLCFEGFLNDGETN